jgi:hypothetical protein
MGNNPSSLKLQEAPGFIKIKANQIPGYEKYDFGNYEIWGPYKKTLAPGFLGSIQWQDAPMNKTVDGALVLDACNGIQGKLKPNSKGSIDGTILRSYSSFNTKPNVGTDQPACYEDNTTIMGGKDDGLFYIHYKHPVFARMFHSNPVQSGFGGILPTLFASNAKRSTPSSMQNILELGFLSSKANNKSKGPKAIYGPLDMAVSVINSKSALINMGQKRVLGGTKKIKKNMRRKTRRS